jgi:formylglycine-generating enzyme required for sulfatase activity
MKRNAFLFCLAIFAMIYTTCKVWGDRDNPVDTDADDYQGVPTVGSPSEIHVVSPADGGTLSGVQVTVDKVAGAATYAIRLATSAEDLVSSPLFYGTGYSTNVFDLSAAPLLNATEYYTQAGATISGGLAWGKVFSFKTDFSMPAATPTFSPSGGTYMSDQSVTISCATPYATIYYTTDGTMPTTSSSKYAGPVAASVSGNGTTIEAIATATGYSASAAGSASYNVLPQLPLSMVYVPGGTFYNGGSDVTVSDFRMAKYDVTQGQYQTVMGTNPSYFSSNPTSCPVENVTWYDAVEFCNKLSDREGLQEVYAITGRTPVSGYPITSATVTMDMTKNGYRLPTEAEYMWAAMGGSSDGIASDFIGAINYYGYEKGYAGSLESGGQQSNIGSCAWYSGNSDGTTHPVGTKAANELGLDDMSGNVSQWCWDWSGYYPSGAQKNPVGPTSGTYRVYRGGSSVASASYYCTVGYRDANVPGYRDEQIGFRVVAFAGLDITVY